MTRRPGEREETEKGRVGIDECWTREAFKRRRTLEGMKRQLSTSSEVEVKLGAVGRGVGSG